MSFKSPMRLVPTIRARMEAALGSLPQQYYQKVLSYGPIAYWPLWEAAGLTAECLVNSPAQDGTYTGVTLGQTITDANGISFVCPFFDGANDYVDIRSATLTTVFDGDVGSAGVWGRVFNTGVWTDGADRAVVRFTEATGFNEATIPKFSVNNQFRWRTKRNNVFVGTVTAETSLNWELWSMSWDANNFYLYRSGTLRATVPLVQPWSAAMTFAMIGAISVVPGWPWHGWLSNCMLFDYTVPQTTWQDLATV